MICATTNVTMTVATSTTTGKALRQKMIVFGFWNLNAKPLTGLAAEFATQLAGPANTDVVLAFAEPAALEKATLEAQLGPSWKLQTLPTEKFTIVTNIPGQISSAAVIGRAYCMSLKRPSGGLDEFNICFAHLSAPIGTFYPGSPKLSQAQRLREDIEDFEARNSIAETVVLGDLNMDPFDPAMLTSAGLNAAMCRKIAARGTRRRTLNSATPPVRFFYNPMFGLLGDRTDSNQPGSFYKSGDPHDALIWHCLDQALVRPKLSDKIVTQTPRILTKLAATELLTKQGVVDKSFSDHLPIMLSLTL